MHQPRATGTEERVRTSPTEGLVRFCPQIVFREVNENIAGLTGLLSETGYQLFICECSDVKCAESLELTSEEYEAIRAHEIRFVVKPGHQVAALERVVGGNGRFLVVETTGKAAEIAQANSPCRQ